MKDIMMYNMTEMETALEAFQKASEEWEKARSRWERYRTEARTKVRARYSDLDPDRSFLEQVRERKHLSEEADAAVALEKEAIADERIAFAVRRVAGRNAAKAASNLLLRVLSENEKMRNTPPRYKKFEAFAEELLGKEFLIKHNDDLAVMFLPGEYNYNWETVCPLEDGLVRLPDPPLSMYVATYDEILEEVRKAANCAFEMENAIKKLREQRDKEKSGYKTDARYLLPGIDYNALRIEYHFDRQD